MVENHLGMKIAFMFASMLYDICLDFLKPFKKDGCYTYQSVFSVHIKNCEPFVPGPELAIDRMPAIRKRY